MIIERDDVWKLPLPADAKRYARRKGLKSMMRQPTDFIKVNAELTNPGKPNKFVNYDAVGAVKHAIKDSKNATARRQYIDKTSSKLLEELSRPS